MLQPFPNKLHRRSRPHLAACHEQREQRRTFGETLQRHLTKVMDDGGRLVLDLAVGIGEGGVGCLASEEAQEVDGSGAAVGFGEVDEAGVVGFGADPGLQGGFDFVGSIGE